MGKHIVSAEILAVITGLAGVKAYLTILGVLFICGLGVPIPEDITLFTAGFLAYKGRISLIGALLAYWSLADFQQVLPFILAIAASSFIYIAVADLIPGLHKRLHISATLQQLTLIVAGVLVIYLAHSTLH